MRTWAFGVVCGAIAMYLYLNGFGPIVGWVQGWYVKAASPHATALQQQ